MIWDGLLLAIVLYNMLRGASRGGRMVAAEVSAFLITYAAVLTLGPIFAALLRNHVDASSFAVSFTSALVIYFGVRRLFRIYIRRLKEAAANDSAASHALPSNARWSGAFFGAMRGGIAAIAIAVMVSGVARLQNVGMMDSLPAARASVFVAPADGLIEIVMQRYTHSAGPTAKRIVEIALAPDPASIAAFINGPFVARIMKSEPVQELADDGEVRSLIEEQRTSELLFHPAFVRVVDFVMDELRKEEDPQTSPTSPAN